MTSCWFWRSRESIHWSLQSPATTTTITSAEWTRYWLTFRSGNTSTTADRRTTATPEAVEEQLAEKHIKTPAPPWPVIKLGDVTITVFPSRLGPSEATENTSSLGVLVERGSFRALLTGDSEVKELNAWMAAGVIPDVDVLKAAHHGARNGVTPGWLNVTKPEVVVISVGATNGDGHPEPWALRYYAAGKRTVYRTDRDGTVVVKVDRKGKYSVRNAGADRAGVGASSMAWECREAGFATCLREALAKSSGREMTSGAYASLGDHVSSASSTSGRSSAGRQRSTTRASISTIQYSGTPARW